MHLRAFVLLPLRDLAPGLALQGKPIGDWIAAIHDQPITRIAD
jgi:2-amino-4-hydroxy-6-hydroxymethyldihydropteridine diphosphokinase